jgi:tetratricopeptide (TPR) repeat protein
MKNKFNYIITAVMLVMASSCTDFLDIKPMDKMVMEDYWKTQSDVESTVLACYRAMEEDGFMERIILAGELRSDNVIVDETKLHTPTEVVHINDLTIKPTNGILKWQDFYRVINYCNAVLEFAPGVVEIDPNYTSGFMRAHLAEAYALRALTYFYLVRIYKDVPYIDFHYKEDTQDFLIPQTSGDEILHLLTEQLETAEKYAMLSWGGNNIWQKGRVTKNMIRILLADIYLWLGEYDKCIAACERIEPDILGDNEYISSELATGAELRLISNQTFTLNAFEQVFFLGNSMESIFELQFRIPGQTNDKLTSLYYGDVDKIGHLAAATFSAYDDGNLFPTTGHDVRGTTSFTPVSKTGNFPGFSQIIKYFSIIMATGTDYFSYISRNIDTNPPNWIFYRVADVYLIKAEALIERNGAGDLDLALALINLTYQRSNPEGVALLWENYNTQALMRKLVFDERQREFLFEGKRWFDMLRMALKEDRAAGGKDSHPEVLNYMTRKYTYNGDVIRSKMIHTDALYLPIYSDELINNTALKQNSYYEVNMGR